MNHNKEDEAGYNEAPKFGPSEGNPPKLEYREEYVFDNKEVDITLPSAELSDIADLKYFFHKYLFSVERGRPNQRMANNLKTFIDIIQVKNLTNENGK